MSRLLYADLESAGAVARLPDHLRGTGGLLCFRRSSPAGGRRVSAISAQTTTGFANTLGVRIAGGGPMVLIVSMGIGGDMGLTAGGIKILRWLVLIRLLRIAVRPHRRAASRRHRTVCRGAPSQRCGNWRRRSAS